jgi:uncharacterized protein YbcV (DUF1398 family)
MNTTTQTLREIAHGCFEGSEANTLTFPEGVRTIASAGFNGYLVDYRSGTRTYHHSNGETFAFQGPAYSPVDAFDAGVVQAAIKEAQQMVPGYTYQGFSRKVTGRGGAAGYLVSIVGKRVLYFGANGETHTEHFPGTSPTTALSKPAREIHGTS